MAGSARKLACNRYRLSFDFKGTRYRRAMLDVSAAALIIEPPRGLVLFITCHLSPFSI